MKTIKILALVSLLTVTQSFAFSKAERNFLLGLGTGAIIIHTLASHNNNQYEKPHHKIVYRGANHSHRKHKKHHMRKHHKHAHHHYGRSHRHNKHYHSNNYRYNSLAVNRHHRY